MKQQIRQAYFAGYLHGSMYEN